MADRPCPRCGSLEGRMAPSPVWIDAARCASCREQSSNAEWARGKPWTQAEIDQMLKVTR